MTRFLTIPKEEIFLHKFITYDVLRNTDERIERQSALEKAVRLGNSFKGKVRLVFETLDGTYGVETTIWETSEDFVVLKGAVTIPVNAIRQVII